MTARPRSLAALIRAVDALAEAAAEVEAGAAGHRGHHAAAGGHAQTRGNPGAGHPGHRGHPETASSDRTPPDAIGGGPGGRDDARDDGAQNISFRGGYGGHGGHCQASRGFARGHLRDAGGHGEAVRGAQAPGSDPAEVLTRVGFLEHDGGLDRTEAERRSAAELGGVPLEWLEGAARLVGMRCPRGYPSADWAHVAGDAARFVAGWGARAAGLGWPAWALFGCHRRAPGAVHGLGLVLLLHGCPVAALSDAEAAIRQPSGRTLTYRRPRRDPLHPAERALIWEMAP